MPKKPTRKRKKRTGASQIKRKLEARRKERDAREPDQDTVPSIGIHVDLSKMPPGLRQMRFAESHEFQTELKTMSDMLDEYEGLAADVFSDDPESMIPLLDLLNGAGVFDERFQEAYTNAARQNILDWERHSNEMIKQFGAYGEYHVDQEFQRTGRERFRRLSRSKPLMRIVLGELGLAQHLVGMRKDYDQGKTPNQIKGQLHQDLKGELPHANFINLLVVDKVYGKHFRMGQQSRENFEAYSNNVLELVQDVEFQSVPHEQVRRHGWFTPAPAGERGKLVGIIRVYVEENNHPFTICSYDITTPKGGRLFHGNISRLTGKPVLPATSFASIELGLATPGLYESLRASIMRAVRNSVENDVFVEVEGEQESTHEVPQVVVPDPSVETTTEVSTVSYEESVQDVVHPRQPALELPIVGDNDPVQEIVRVPLPSMTYFQFASTLRRAKVVIHSGGKHLEAVKGDRSTTFYNNHSGERRFQSSEVQRIVDALDIYDLFVDKMPRRLKSTYQQRVAKRAKKS